LPARVSLDRSQISHGVNSHRLDPLGTVARVLLDQQGANDDGANDVGRLTRVLSFPRGEFIIKLYQPFGGLITVFSISNNNNCDILKKNDIILGIDGVEVSESTDIEFLENMIMEKNNNEVLTFTVIRDNVQTVRVQNIMEKASRKRKKGETVYSQTRLSVFIWSYKSKQIHGQDLQDT
jgi:hypothetical protein